MADASAAERTENHLQAMRRLVTLKKDVLDKQAAVAQAKRLEEIELLEKQNAMLDAALLKSQVLEPRDDKKSHKSKKHEKHKSHRKSRSRSRQGEQKLRASSSPPAQEPGLAPLPGPSACKQEPPSRQRSRTPQKAARAHASALTSPRQEHQFQHGQASTRSPSLQQQDSGQARGGATRRRRSPPLPHRQPQSSRPQSQTTSSHQSQTASQTERFARLIARPRSPSPDPPPPPPQEELRVARGREKSRSQGSRHQQRNAKLSARPQSPSPVPPPQSELREARGNSRSTSPDWERPPSEGARSCHRSLSPSVAPPDLGRRAARQMHAARRQANNPRKRTRQRHR
jgi:hypothetical protein